jgi:hypothetical protein
LGSRQPPKTFKKIHVTDVSKVATTEPVVVSLKDGVQISYSEIINPKFKSKGRMNHVAGGMAGVILGNTDLFASQLQSVPGIYFQNGEPSVTGAAFPGEGQATVVGALGGSRRKLSGMPRPKGAKQPLGPHA